MWKKLDAFFYGIEQRIAKWKRSRTPEYRAGKKAWRDYLNQWQNPYAPGTEERELWLEGWMDEENRT